MADPVLRFQGASTGQPGPGLSLDVAPGEFVTMLAEQGASAPLLALAGFAPVTQGHVFVRGVPMGRTPAHRRNLGLVQADPGLFPHLTAAANVAFPLTVRGIGRAGRTQQTTAIMQRLGIADLADRKPDSLTCAQALRVALARALVFTPPAVLLDNPATRLDQATRAAWWEDVRHVQRATGTAMLLATRDAATALAVSDRVAVLHNDAALQIAPPAELYEEPASPLVATLTGEINLLPGRIQAIADGSAEIHLRAGPIVSGRLADALHVGDQCLLAIRPERIALAAVEARRMGADAIPAVVEDMTFHGDHTRLRLVIGEGLVLLVRRPAAAGTSGLVPNRPAALAWRADHARVFRVG